MRGIYLTAALLGIIVLSLPVNVSRAAVVYPLEVITNNGGYYNSADMNLYVQVSNGGDEVDFTFYNENLFASSISRIYFDGGLLLGIAEITEGSGTSFSHPATPGNLPGGNPLEPPFVATAGFSIGSDAPRPDNGVNPGEWITVAFDLINAGTFSDVIDELNTGALRTGVHVIGLPDGSSESAVAVPEPGTVFLLGLGGLVLLGKRRV